MKETGTIYKIILAVMLAVILILTCIIICLVITSKGKKDEAAKPDVSHYEEQPEEADQSSRGVVVNKDNAEEIAADLDQNSPRPQSYEVIMNTKWLFEDGINSTNAYVQNSRDNNNDVVFTIALEENPDKPVYTSDIITIGSSIKGISLKETIPEGEHKAVVTYKLLDENGGIAGEVRAGVTLVREE